MGATTLPFEKFIEWAFLGMIGGGIAFAVHFLSKICSEMAHVNEKLAVVISKQDRHQVELDRHNDRLHTLEVSHSLLKG